MDKQTLTSSTAAADPSRYAVGILGGNELHMTPLQGVLQLRPNLGYLDKSDKTAKAEGRATLAEDNADDPADAAGAEEDVKQVTVRFAKSDSDAAKKYREKSYDYQVRKREEEPWIPTRHHHMKTGWWEEESQKLFCKKMDDEIVGNGESDSDLYLERLMRAEEAGAALPGAAGVKVEEPAAAAAGTARVKKEK